MTNNNAELMNKNELAGKAIRFSFFLSFIFIAHLSRFWLVTVSHLHTHTHAPWINRTEADEPEDMTSTRPLVLISCNNQSKQRWRLKVRTRFALIAKDEL